MKEIPLTQGQVALVDDEDYEWLNKFNWYYSPRHGAIRNKKDKTGKYKTINMSREILEYHGIVLGKLYADHKNGIKTDNTKDNLRPATSSQNAANTFKYGTKGVWYDKNVNKWKAGIRVNNKYIHLGYFITEQEAAEAYNKAARVYFGEFAKLNEPMVVVEDVGYGNKK